MIETHYNPSNALSDGYQTISLPTFEKLHGRIRKLAQFVNERD